jgi:hypothetical protein
MAPVLSIKLESELTFIIDKLDYFRIQFEKH